MASSMRLGLLRSPSRCLASPASVQKIMRSELILRPFFWTKAKGPDETPPERASKVARGGVNILTVGAGDREAVVRCLRRTFFRDEPLLRCAGLAGRVPAAMEEYVLTSLREGISFLATGRSASEVHGVCVNATMRRNDKGTACVSAEAREAMGPASRQVLDFWDFCDRSSDLFSRFFVSHIWEVRYLGTEPAWRGRGIAKAMTQRSIELAHALGYPLVTMHCTSHYSRKVAQSVGMSEVWSLPYDEYVNEKGKPVFKPDHPHTGVAVMVLSL